MTLALALKGRQGVLFMCDRLEHREKCTVEVRKMYRHPWGLISGYGKGHILTPVKEYLEDLAGRSEHEIGQALGRFSPLEIVHAVIEGMVGEMRDAWQETGEATFLYSLPTGYVPAGYSKVPSSHPLAVIVDTGDQLHETGHANFPVGSPVADRFERLVRDLDWPPRDLDYLEDQLCAFLTGECLRDVISATVDIGIHRNDGSIRISERVLW